MFSCSPEPSGPTLLNSLCSPTAPLPFQLSVDMKCLGSEANNQLEGSRAQSPDARASLEATDLVDTEPSWSLFIPSSTLTVAPGRERTFEVEEVAWERVGLALFGCCLSSLSCTSCLPSSPQRDKCSLSQRGSFEGCSARHAQRHGAHVEALGNHTFANDGPFFIAFPETQPRRAAKHEPFLPSCAGAAVCATRGNIVLRMSTGFGRARNNLPFFSDCKDQWAWVVLQTVTHTLPRF